MPKQFYGPWPAIITPTTAEGDVNVQMLRDLTEYLIAKNVGGFYVCGTTGEGVFMSVSERKLVANTVMEQVAGRVPIIVHVGTVATWHAVELAQHARSIGADGVASILPPFYRGVAAIYAHYETIAAAVPELPFYPYLFGGQTDAISLMRALSERIPNLAGAKYTGPNMHELRALVDAAGEGWTLFSGMDEQCAFAAMFGATANIGSTLNFMPGVYGEIRASCARGDLRRAQDLQIRANRVTRTLQDFGFLGALREAVRLLGFDCGTPRMPNLPLPAEQHDAFLKALDATDFSELAAL